MALVNAIDDMIAIEKESLFAGNDLYGGAVSASEVLLEPSV